MPAKGLHLFISKEVGTTPIWSPAIVSSLVLTKAPEISTEVQNHS